MNDQYVIVAVRVQVQNGEPVHIEAASVEDVKTSLRTIGGVADKNKLMKLLSSYGGMLKGFLK